MPAHSNPNQIFADAHAALLRGEANACLEQLGPLTQLVGPNPAISHLQALALQSIGNEAEALQAFKSALALQPSPGDPYIFANAAKLHETLRHDETALQLFDQAIIAGPGCVDVHVARFNAIRRLRGDEEAAAAYTAVLAQYPDNGELNHYHALFLRDCGESRRALAATECALALRPQSLNLRHLHARLLLDMNEPEPEVFKRLQEQAPEDEGVLMGHAAALVRAGEVSSGLSVLDTGLKRHPEWDQAFQTRLSISQQFLSFEATEEWLRNLVEQQPSVAGRELSLTRLIWRGRGANAALEELGRRGSALDDDASARELRAELLSEAGDHDAAQQIFSALETDQTSLATMPLIRHLFRIGEVERATEMSHALARQTGMIEAWAHVELGWRALNDPRWDWLMGSGRLIWHGGLSRFADYGAKLTEALRRLHAPIRNHPLEQSPRNGTQTDGMLFALDDSSIRALVADIKLSATKFLANLPDLGRDHPLDRLRRRNFRFSGSWSIRLTQQGFHTPHFHNEGLVSSACYINLPDEIESGSGRDRKAGWLELGRPPANLGLDLPPMREIEPRVGTLALFPSFLLHGTRPFSDGERLTAAFDITSIPD